MAQKGKKGGKSAPGGGSPREEPGGRRAFWFGIAGTLLAAITMTAAAVHYVETSSHQLKTDEIKRDADARVLEIKRSYEQRLRSIEFGLGGKDQYFDISRVLLAPQEVPTLPSSVRRFEIAADVSFFVDDYPGGPWKIINTNEYELTKMMVGAAQAEREAGSSGGVRDLKEAPIFLFVHPDRYRVDLGRRRRDAKAAPVLNLFPVIVVQALDHKFLEDIIGAPASAKSEVRDLLVSRARIADPMGRYSVDERLATALDEIYRTEFAGRALYGFIDNGLKYFTDYVGVQYRLHNVQKQRNVVFLQSQLLFFNVAVGAPATERTLRVDEITFFFNGRDRSFLVRAFVPSYVDAPSPYDEWVRRWLAGFRFAW
jgi:hypothetical protein